MSATIRFQDRSRQPVDGEVAEWSNAAVLKTVEPKGSGGSNPSLSARLVAPIARAANGARRIPLERCSSSS
jgi:hypothetical protein